MVDDDGKKGGRRGKKKSRGRQQSLGENNPGGRVARDRQGNGDSAAGAKDQASFPVVSDSRFSSMHSAPVRNIYNQVNAVRRCGVSSAMVEANLSGE